MASLTLTNYTKKAAKAIVKRLYEADVQSSLWPNGLALRGSSIMADAKGEDDSYTIEISSSVYEEKTLRDLVEEGLDRL
jgi:hypothetical protein